MNRLCATRHVLVRRISQRKLCGANGANYFPETKVHLSPLQSRLSGHDNWPRSEAIIFREHIPVRRRVKAIASLQFWCIFGPNFASFIAITFYITLTWDVGVTKLDTSYEHGVYIYSGVVVCPLMAAHRLQRTSLRHTVDSVNDFPAGHIAGTRLIQLLRDSSVTWSKTLDNYIMHREETFVQHSELCVNVMP